MLYEPYEFEEEELFKRALEVSLLSFRAAKSVKALEDSWTGESLREAALSLCQLTADGLRRRAASPEEARERFSAAVGQVARMESLWLVAASLGQVDQEAFHLFRERLKAPLSLLSRALSREGEAGPAPAGA